MAAPDPIPDLLKAVNEASGKAFALWITFLTVGTYLAISIGTTTHLQLLLAGPVKLPLLGVDLPLFAFYGFAPPIFVVLHLYVLMQLYLLARLLRRFDNHLQSARILAQDREAIRDQLDKFAFTQSLIGEPQDWIVRWFLSAAVLLSFVVGPRSAAARLPAPVPTLPQRRGHLRAPGHTARRPRAVAVVMAQDIPPCAAAARLESALSRRSRGSYRRSAGRVLGACPDRPGRTGKPTSTARLGLASV
jgi:hypothetical protein